MIVLVSDKNNKCGFKMNSRQHSKTEVMSTPTIKEAISFLDRFYVLTAIQHDSAHQQLIKMKDELMAIDALPPEDENNREKLSKSVSNILSEHIYVSRFKDIFIDDISFDTMLYKTGLALAGICPINKEDFATLDKIDPNDRVVTFDRYQFDVHSLVELLKTQSLATLSNPSTREPFIERDKQHILACVKSFMNGKSVELHTGNPFPGGDPNLDASIALAHELQTLPQTARPWSARLYGEGYALGPHVTFHSLSDSPIEASELSNEAIVMQSSALLTTSYILNDYLTHTAATGIVNNAVAALLEQRRFIARSGLNQNLVNLYLRHLSSVQDRRSDSTFPSNPDELATTPSTSGLFSESTTPNIPMRYVYQEINSHVECKITMGQLQQWRPHTRGAEFTYGHAEALITLIAYRSHSTDDAIQAIMYKSEEEARQLIQPTRGPSPSRMEEID